MPGDGVKISNYIQRYDYFPFRIRVEKIYKSPNLPRIFCQISFEKELRSWTLWLRLSSPDDYD